MSSRQIRTAILGFLGGAALVAMFFFLFVERTPRSPQDITPIDGTTLETAPARAIEWREYRNEIFGFSLEYPASWQIVEKTSSGVPMITIYKPDSAVSSGSDVSTEAPYTHFSNATHVSIYPSGVPTAGVIGFTQPSTVPFVPQTEQATDYFAVPPGTSFAVFDAEALTDAGKPWATYVTFTAPPTNWKPWGFVWAGVAMSEHASICFRMGERIPSDTCDPLTGDDVVHEGIPDPTDREIEKRILASLRFID